MEQVKTDPRVLYGDLLAAQQFDARPLLGAIRVPALVVHGSDDQVIAAADAQALAAGITGARFVSVDGAGHVPQLEQPARIHQLLTSFEAELA